MSHPMTTTEKRAMKPSQRLKPLRDAYSREHDKYARGCAPAPNKEEMDAADRKASDALHTILDELDATTRRNSEACEIAMRYIGADTDPALSECQAAARQWLAPKAPPCKPQSSSEQSASSSSSSGPSTATAPTSSPTEWGPEVVKVWRQLPGEAHDGCCTLKDDGRIYNQDGDPCIKTADEHDKNPEWQVIYTRPEKPEQGSKPPEQASNGQQSMADHPHSVKYVDDVGRCLKCVEDVLLARATKAESDLAASRERCEKQAALIQAWRVAIPDIRWLDRRSGIQAANKELSKLGEVKRD